MALLCRTNQVVGETVILDSNPTILDLSDVVYVPVHDPRSSDGIFDQGRKRVIQTAYFRGPNVEDLVPPLIMGYRYELWDIVTKKLKSMLLRMFTFIVVLFTLIMDIFSYQLSAVSGQRFVKYFQMPKYFTLQIKVWISGLIKTPICLNYLVL